MDFKRERKKRGWSVEEVAVKMGVTVASIYRWEQGKIPHKVFLKELKAIFKGVKK